MAVFVLASFCSKPVVLRHPIRERSAACTSTTAVMVMVDFMTVEWIVKLEF
jgi:hypothetical protein